MLGLVALSANAQEQFTVGNLTYVTTGPTTVEVSKLDSKATGDVVIPSTVANASNVEFTVTSIGEEACKWSGASSISLPETLDSIKRSAFSGASFSNIELPQNLRYIGPYAFSSCKLTTIDIPGSVDTIGEHAFFGSSYAPTLTSVTLHEGLKVIGTSAFYGNDLKEIDIPSTVTRIEATAFLRSRNLKKVTLHDGLLYIGDGAFNVCPLLSDIVLPATLEEMGIEVFLNDPALTSINIPAGLKTMGEGCFGGTSLATITLDPANENFILDNGVLYTTDHKLLQQAPLRGLTTLNVNSNCLGISGGAFWGSELESITLPDNLVAIGYGAFLGSKLNSINWPKRLSFIDEQAFANTQFTEITLPSTVYFINDGVFAGCNNLTKVTMPSGVTQVYAHAFQNCKSLTNFVAQGSTAPEIMPYYETYDAPFFGISESATLTVPKGASDSYRSTGWGDYFNIVEAETGTLTIKSISPADSSYLGKYASLSFSVTFNENVSLVENHPDVIIRQDANYSATYIEPTGDPQWTAMVETCNTLTVFGNDYDGYMDFFMPEEGKIYYVNIPAGVVKDDTGATNEQITIVYYGPKPTTGIDAVSTPEKSDAKVIGRYNLNGQAVGEAHKGVQILKYSDGTSRKVIIK